MNRYKIAICIFQLSTRNLYDRDPVLFPDYDEFRPSRFLDASGKVDETPPDTLSMGHVTYGFGKRCVWRPQLFCSLSECLQYLLWHESGKSGAFHRYRLHLVGATHRAANRRSWKPDRPVQGRVY